MCSDHRQDFFVHNVLPGNYGTFLDIGSHKPVAANNTFQLERLGWRGLAFDITDWSEDWVNNRVSKFINTDVTKFNWKKELPKYPIFDNKVIDYISFDVDDATISAFENFPFDEYEFKVMTIEHDKYRVGDATKNFICKYLLEKGYVLLCEDVCANYPGQEFEDWWVNPKYVNMLSVEKFRSKSKMCTDIV